MNNEKKGDSLQGKELPSTGAEPEVKPVSVKKPQSFFGERPLPAIEMAPRVLRYRSRRDFLLFGAGALAALFGEYNAARVWHFWLMWVYILFVVPHVILVFADGWDTLRSMIVGWSTRAERLKVAANEQ